MVMTTFWTQRARVHRKERLARQSEALKVQKLDFFSSFLALDWMENGSTWTGVYGN